MPKILLIGTLGASLLAVFFYLAVLPSPLSVTSVEAQSASLIEVMHEAPTVSASAYYVFELESGNEVVSFQSEKVLPIASVTKLISTTIFYKVADLKTETRIQESDVATEGLAGHLKVGDTYTLNELIFPALLESSNDASSVQARTLNKNMPSAMNEFVSTLGIADTAFTDASGLSSGNVSSARSLSIILKAIYDEYPHVIDITKLTKYVGAQTTWMNNSPLRDLPGYAGGKHGYTHEAGRTAAVIFEEEVSGDKRSFGYIVLGSENLVTDIEELREYVQATLK